MRFAVSITLVILFLGIFSSCGRKVRGDKHVVFKLKLVNDSSPDKLEETKEALVNRFYNYSVQEDQLKMSIEGDLLIVELIGIDDINMARYVVSSRGQLNFHETYELTELFPSLEKWNTFLGNELNKNDTVFVEDSIPQDTSLIGKVSEYESSEDIYKKENPLYAILRPALSQDNDQYFPMSGPTIGYVAIKDTAKVREYLGYGEVKRMFPRSFNIMWESKPYDEEGKFLRLIAVNKEKYISGNKVLENAAVQYGDNGMAEISIQMNSRGAGQWAEMTETNIGKSIAVTIDGLVYSFPTVTGKIEGGRSVVSGSFSEEEAQNIVSVFKSATLPYPIKIVEEELKELK